MLDENTHTEFEFYLLMHCNELLVKYNAIMCKLFLILCSLCEKKGAIPHIEGLHLVYRYVIYENLIGKLYIA
jgi:hypothetical protein